MILKERGWGRDGRGKEEIEGGRKEKEWGEGKGRKRRMGGKKWRGRNPPNMKTLLWTV